MRFVPNRLQVEIHERTPIAFARVGPRIFLIDAGGILMDLPPKHKYSFPVILGMNPGEPISTRLPRMKAYNDLVQALDSSGARYSQDLSEVDLSDLDNLKVRVNDPAGDVLVELGSTNYLNRYQTYVGHVRDWRRQFQKLESVNLRYDNQVIVNPDMEGKPRQATISPSVAKAAIAAGVKPASLNTRIGPHEKPIPKPVFEMSDKKLDPKATTKKPLVKAKTKKTPAKPSKAVAKKDAAKHPVPPAKTSAAGQPAAKKPSASVAGNTTPKPSPGIAKQQGAGVN
jgi:cell division protein FtsQ